MESINLSINDGKKKVILNDDENKVLIFNPNDLESRRKMYSVNEKILEYDKKFKEKIKTLKENKDIEKVFELEEEMHNFIKNLVDDVFGEGVADMITDKKTNPVALMNFFTAIMPYFLDKVENKRKKYTTDDRYDGVL